jgi:hypothetical protein
MCIEVKNVKNKKFRQHEVTIHFFPVTIRPYKIWVTKVLKKTNVEIDQCRNRSENRSDLIIPKI